MRAKVLRMILVFGLYIFLIDVIGYLFASIVFFLLINRIVGFRSWLVNGGLSIAFSFSFYLIFVEWLDMVFPPGVLFR